MSWQINSLLAALFIGGTILALKWASIHIASPIVLMVYLYMVTLFCFFAHAGVGKISLLSSWKGILIMVLSGVLCYAGNFFQVKAITGAPNAGYASAIISFSAVFITVASIFLFGAAFSLLKAAGVACCVIGVILLSL